MIDEFEDVGDWELERVKIKRSQYQVLPAERVKSHRKEKLWGYLERNEMKNPVYYRLLKKGSFVGFKRIVTEYLPAAANRWQLEPVDHDEEASQKLSQPAMGISKLRREKIISGEQRRVTHPKSKEQAEPAPVPSSGGITE